MISQITVLVSLLTCSEVRTMWVGHHGRAEEAHCRMEIPMVTALTIKSAQYQTGRKGCDLEKSDISKMLYLKVIEQA